MRQSFKSCAIRRLFGWAPVVASLGLGGCAHGGAAAWTADSHLLIMARSVYGGNRIDDLTIDYRDHDKPNFITDYARLQKFPEGLLAQPLAELAGGQAVLDGTDYEAAATGVGTRSKSLLDRETAAEFDYALAIVPPDQSDQLNELGYELADKGTTQADFQLALQFTKLAIDDLDRGTMADGSPYPQLIYRRAITRDSYAWSLFKLGRYPEALATQRRAEKEASQTTRELHASMQPELLFHLGEMYRVSRRPLAAQRQYQKSLKFDPQFARSIKGLQDIQAQVRLAPPGSEPVIDPAID